MGSMYCNVHADCAQMRNVVQVPRAPIVPFDDSMYYTAPPAPPAPPAAGVAAGVAAPVAAAARVVGAAAAAPIGIVRGVFG
jgi:hypothetical protein